MNQIRPYDIPYDKLVLFIKVQPYHIFQGKLSPSIFYPAVFGAPYLDVAV